MTAPSPELVREAAIGQGVCARPVISRVTDLDTGEVRLVPIWCGSHPRGPLPGVRGPGAAAADAAVPGGLAPRHRTRMATRRRRRGDDEDQGDEPTTTTASRRVRSTRRRQDVPDLPRVPVEDRTIGRVFTAPDGKTYRPSMFVTLTLRLLRAGHRRGRARSTPARYDYRRAALDALHFPKLVDRFWQNLRRCAGYQVQYFATIEAQRRLAPHLHTAIRGAIPRALLRQVRAATYHQLWWPPHDTPVYVDRLPVWTDRGYTDPTTGELLPSWDRGARRPRRRPRRRAGARGAVRGPGRHPGPDRRHARARSGPSATCASTSPSPSPPPTTTATTCRRPGWRTSTAWPKKSAGSRARRRVRTGCATASNPPPPRPGWSRGTASTRRTTATNLGLGGRRVLVSRKWSGKTLAAHKADRAAVVRAALEEAGIDPDDHDELSVVGTDGRWSWELLGRNRVDAATYAAAISQAITTRQRWRAEYEAAKASSGRAGAAMRRPARQFGH